MGALRQSKLTTESLRKPVTTETRKLDAYGRDPRSPVEQLRGQAGFAPLYDAFLADLPRLLGGSAVSWALVMTILRLSLGRPHTDKKRHEWTLPISTAELAEYCAAGLRDIQLRLSELEERGVLATKTVKRGGVQHSFRLKTEDWREIEDYAVWKRRQTVTAIDAADANQGETQDESLMEVSKDAVRLFKGSCVVRPGRAARAVRVSVGVREFVFENHSETVDAACTAVIQSGRLIVSTTYQKSESEAKGEEKGNGKRNISRPLPANEGSGKKYESTAIHPLAGQIAELFDPLLIRSASRLISADSRALQAACVAAGAMPIEFLTHFLLSPNGRGLRSISGPTVCAAIVTEARKNWEARGEVPMEVQRRCDCGAEISVNGQCWDCLERDRSNAGD